MQGLPLVSIVLLGVMGVLAAVSHKRRRSKPRFATLRREVLQAFQDISVHGSWDSNAACVLLSGGLDSALVAEVGGAMLGLKAAFTVVCSEDATDLPYAEASATAAYLEHHIVRIGLQELLRRYLPTVVRVTQSFDPMTLRNEVAIAAALSEASARGYRCVATGDGADELLGGYGFTHGLQPAAWAEHRNHMARVMEFGSTRIGAHLGMHVASPFTSARVKAAALEMDKADCVGTVADGRTLGKMPLRKLFPHVTSAMRRKDPIEVGCGTTELSKPGFFDKYISDELYEAEKSYIAVHHGVEIRDKEHLHFYRVFREVFPNGVAPNKVRYGSDPCPKCGYQMSDRFQTFCVTCGHYDPALRKRHAP